MASEGIYNVLSAVVNLPHAVAGIAAGAVWAVAGAESIRSKVEERRSRRKAKKDKGDDQ
jgi:hypothetical protein